MTFILGQTDLLTGSEAVPPPPDYARDADAVAVRLFEPAPAQLPGQTSLMHLIDAPGAGQEGSTP